MQVSWGSFHAITEMMPSLAVRYPFMCYRFLADLELLPLGVCVGVKRWGCVKVGVCVSTK